MSVKSNFLPFIKETSSEEAIFKAILQRTKGSSYSAITNLFSVVLTLGVENIRTEIGNLDSNMTTSAKIEQVVAQGAEQHIQQSERSFWSYISKYLTPKTSNFTRVELEIFFTVIVVCRPEKLSSIGYEIGTEKISKLSEYSKETCKPGISDVHGVTITEDQKFRVGFTCWEEFKAYLAMKFDDKVYTEVCPVFIKTDSNVVTDHVYAENHCKSPYTGENNET